MADQLPEFESVDELGTSVHFNSTVGTSAVSVPSSDGNAIQEFTIYNPQTNAKTAILYVSLDNGTTFRQIPWGCEWGWRTKGRPLHLKLKAAAASTAYEAIINFELTP